jgi:hypothetical protein
VYLTDDKPLIWEKILHGQDLIAEAYKNRSSLTLDKFAQVIKTEYWDRWKEAVDAYDHDGCKKPEEQTGVGH